MYSFNMLMIISWYQKILTYNLLMNFCINRTRHAVRNAVIINIKRQNRPLPGRWSLFR